MYLISVEGYGNSGVTMLILEKPGETWVSMKDLHEGLGLQNMSDPVLKQIYGIYGTKYLTKKEIRKYKMTEREAFKKFSDLSEGKLNTKSNENVSVRNDVMTSIIKQYRGEKKRGHKRKNKKKDAFRKKLMIPDSEIPECPEREIKSKIGNIFANEKILEEYSVKIYKIDPYFYERCGKKYKLMKADANIYYLEFMFIFPNIF